MSLAPPTGTDQEGEFRPSDEAARRTIEHELGKTLFVEASAGTGKTHSLVARTVNLVAEGMTTLDRLVLRCLRFLLQLLADAVPQF